MNAHQRRVRRRLRARQYSKLPKVWVYKQHPTDLPLSADSRFRIEVRGLPRQVSETELEPFARFILAGKYTPYIKTKPDPGEQC